MICTELMVGGESFDLHGAYTGLFFAAVSRVADAV